MSTRILLVEDNEQNRYLVTFLLEQGGFTVVHAPDGRRGLELAAAGPFDLILLDIQLPEIDGYAVARALRALPVHAPIVALTSYAMVGDREHALQAGCDGYLEKPIDPGTFVAEIRRLLRPAPQDGGKKAKP